MKSTDKHDIYDIECVYIINIESLEMDAGEVIGTLRTRRSLEGSGCRCVTMPGSHSCRILLSFRAHVGQRLQLMSHLKPHKTT